MKPCRKPKLKFSIRTTIESNALGAFTRVKFEADEFQIAKPKGAEITTLLNVDLDPEATTILFDANNQDDHLEILKGMSTENSDERNTCLIETDHTKDI